jgi:hypothetical protein
MAKNKISDLRDHLFETLEALKDGEKPMDIDRAKAITEVAQTIINAAKVEVDLVKAVGGSAPGGGFFNLPEETRELPKIEPAPNGRKQIAAKPQ